MVEERGRGTGGEERVENKGIGGTMDRGRDRNKERHG